MPIDETADGESGEAGGDSADAGPVAAWLDATDRARRGVADADVPCGSCVACCTSSQFVHIGPDEHDALAHIPRRWLAPAPMMPPGHAILGYDEDGRCPMLTPAGCSIYEHRPRACRTYDCRVFAAAAIDPADDGHDDIAARTRRWRFTIADERDLDALTAIRAAAEFLAAHPEVVDMPAGATARAVLAVDAHAAFADGHEPSVAEVRVLIRTADEGMGNSPQ